MKSIKPGRGPSLMGGIISIVMGIFGVFWTILTISAGVWFMGIFGVLFIIIAVTQAIFNFKNATSKNRYSSFDIVDSQQEPDPLNKYFGGAASDSFDSCSTSTGTGKNSFCPYCGAVTKEDHIFCSSCGKKLP